MKMNEKEREKLYEVMKKIIDKHKDKTLLYKKLKRTIDRFQHSNPTNKKTYERLANLTKKINYRCYFKDGECKRYKGKEYPKQKKAMCCCSNCKYDFGYLKKIYFNQYSDEDYIEEELLYYAKKFSINTGFWRDGIGCILPRNRRSATCLGYNCTDKLTTEEKLVFTLLYKEEFPDYIESLIIILEKYFLYRDE